jgi:hypothetical protein
MLAFGDEPTDRVAAQLGEVTVQHDDIVRVDVDPGSRINTVVDDIDREATVTQPLSLPSRIGLPLLAAAAGTWFPRQEGRIRVSCPLPAF